MHSVMRIISPPEHSEGENFIEHLPQYGDCCKLSLTIIIIMKNPSGENGLMDSCILGGDKMLSLCFQSY